MLLNMIKSGDFSAQTIISLLLYIIIILISLSVHELSHGYAAYLCGDSTARDLGRLTLNPLAHLDPIGTVMMLAFGFGYAKPVPINPRRFKHYKRDLCIVSLAGPFSNLLLAFFGTIVYYLFLIFLPYSAKMSIPGGVWLSFCSSFIMANTSLCVFNLLPIPPLDGSRILSAALPGKIAYYYLKYERYIMIAMFVLLAQGALDNLLTFLSRGLLNGILAVVDFIFTPLITWIFG